MFSRFPGEEQGEAVKDVLRTNNPSKLFFFFMDTATTEIYTLSLHDALPISPGPLVRVRLEAYAAVTTASLQFGARDRKSTRLNSSHLVISYAVFCLKKK